MEDKNDIEEVQNVDIETALDNTLYYRPKNVKYKLRQRVGDYVALEIVLLHFPGAIREAWVEVRHTNATAGGTVFHELGQLDSPDELLVLAKMALLAWEQMVNLKAV